MSEAAPAAIMSWRWPNIFSVALMVFIIAFVATVGVKTARNFGQGKEA